MCVYYLIGKLYFLCHILNDWTKFICFLAFSWLLLLAIKYTIYILSRPVIQHHALKQIKIVKNKQIFSYNKIYQIKEQRSVINKNKLAFRDICKALT